MRVTEKTRKRIKNKEKKKGKKKRKTKYLQSLTWNRASVSHSTFNMAALALSKPFICSQSSSVTKAPPTRSGLFRLLATSAKPPGVPPIKPRVAPKPNMENIKHIVAVASGKGGVGKSTVAGIAFWLS